MITIFAGPTISVDDIHDILEDVEVLAPAAVGDVYKAAKSEPEAIGLIDGYFDSVPSVWHKEILFALDRGIPVFGASSMGALRAAELHVFGMIGVGRIFKDYKTGVLEDDDEVAVIHGPGEVGYPLLSEPMVNIRVTLERALLEDVVSAESATRMIAQAKATHYHHRQWSALFTDADPTALDPAELRRLEAWFPTNKIDQKHLDAVEMLEEIKQSLRQVERPSPVPFEFQHTVMWRQLVEQIEAVSTPLAHIVALDVLRHDADRYRGIRSQVAEKLAANGEGNKDRSSPTAEDLSHAITQFRLHNQLFTATAFKDWLAAQNLTQEAFEGRIRKELEEKNIISAASDRYATLVFEALSDDPSMADLLNEVTRQTGLLTQAGYSPHSSVQTSLQPTELLLWYFETKLKQPVPGDMETYLLDHDFTDFGQFERMMARQHIIWQKGKV